MSDNEKLTMAAVAFAAIIFAGMLVGGLAGQSNKIADLEDENAELRQELTIKNDIINQINMRNEGQYYMEQEGGENE